MIIGNELEGFGIIPILVSLQTMRWHSDIN